MTCNKPVGLTDSLLYKIARHQGHGCAQKSLGPSLIVFGQQTLQRCLLLMLVSQPFPQADPSDRIQVMLAYLTSDEAVPVKEVLVLFTGKIAALCTCGKALCLNAAVV